MHVKILLLSGFATFLLISAFGCQTQVRKGPVYPKGIDPLQTSIDPTYGYSVRNPVQVGGPKGFSGPQSERLYLSHLRDRFFKPLVYFRRGSTVGNPDRHIVDIYVLKDSAGDTHILYLDMYHPEVHPFTVKAPKGLYFFK